MKRALTAAGAALALAVCLTLALAAGGDSSDPLVSLSYLQGAFAQTVETAVDERISQSAVSAQSSAQASGLQEATLNEADAVTGSTGLTVVPLAGTVRLTVSSGAVVDATAGREVASGETLTANHRYIAAENASVRFAAVSSTAVVSYESGTLTRSGAGPDYYAMAQALGALDLFKGGSESYGEGFALSSAPTRGEGLVMFIRLLGEESQALACTASHPFTDVPAWLDRYVAWAYTKGYTNGVSATLFAPSGELLPQAYEEFLLRAMGYSVAGGEDFMTSLDRAVSYGLLTASERTLLTGTFLRAQVAYVSYYALDGALNGSRESLGQRLVSAGVFTQDQLAQAKALVTSARLS